MNCPACETALHRLTFQGLELDECRRCRGVWFDHQEIGQLLTLQRIPRRFLETAEQRTPLKRVEEGRRVCPRCEVGLELAEVEGVRLDTCPECRGFFADAGEIRRLFDAL